MHVANTVVTLVDSKGKPFRELASTRTQMGGRMCDIHMPFDTHYGFLIKNQNDVRVKINIDIDGTCVTGGGLILQAKHSEVIERFVDSARKFKFVRASHEAVADPTNPDNGEVRVTITREQTPKVVYIPVPMWRDPYPVYGPGSWSSNNLRLGARGPAGPQGIPGPVGHSGILRGMAFSNVSAEVSCSTAMPCSADYSEKGATVEGAHSSQVFGTTHWAGDEVGSDVTFVFNLRSRSSQDEAEYQEYLRLKARFE